jgi:penicillin-binding protein 1B
MIRNRLKTILAGFTITLTLLIIVPTAAFFSFEKDFEGRLDSKKFLTTTEYFAQPVTFRPRQQVTAIAIEKLLSEMGYRPRDPGQILMAGDSVKLDRAQCFEKFKESFPDQGKDQATDQAKDQMGVRPEKGLAGVSHCFGFVRIGSSSLESEIAKNQQWILLTEGQEVFATLAGFPLLLVEAVAFDPPLLAQYSDSKPIMQQFKTLSETPPQCLNAVMAIEDWNFLEHSGYSVTGILRALYKNVVTGRRGQGGSTITQQLVKNYFLSQERSYKRKVMELAMSILIESKYSKDEILETYLNIIYMGQNGPFQVIGFGAAAPFYFSKQLKDLNTSECALLGAILNGPGVFNPWSKKDKALQRRNLVLSKMKELNYISESEMLLAQKAEMPIVRPRLAAETAPYFIDAARKQLIQNKIPLAGAKIYTYLNLEWQQIAQDALQKHLQFLETSHKSLKNLKAKGLNLEGVVLVGDPGTGAVTVAVGGRSFRMTQFNRAVDGHRQIGSIMKPFVYLAALEKGSSTKKYYPHTLVSDEKFEIKYEGQTWSPENYSKKYYGQIPLFYGLKNSLNAATAAIGMDVGLERVIEIVKAFGITSQLRPVPALTLGAFEMYPTEVLKAYMGLSQFGRTKEISFVKQVVGEDKKVIYEASPKVTQAVDPISGATLVSMMKQTVLSGTGRGVTTAGFLRPAAGKTGTTSDFKDAWFAGFTPFQTAIVWVGYDNNTPTNLTGGSGAVPIWTDLMKKISVQNSTEDFAWPSGAVKVVISPTQLKELGATQEAEDSAQIELIYRAGEEPRL